MLNAQPTGVLKEKNEEIFYDDKNNLTIYKFHFIKNYLRTFKQNSSRQIWMWMQRRIQL